MSDETRSPHSYPVPGPATETPDPGRRNKGRPKPTPHPGGTGKNSLIVYLPAQAASASPGHRGRPLRVRLPLGTRPPSVHQSGLSGPVLKGQAGPRPGNHKSEVGGDTEGHGHVEPEHSDPAACLHASRVLSFRLGKSCAGHCQVICGLRQPTSRPHTLRGRIPAGEAA